MSILVGINSAEPTVVRKGKLLCKLFDGSVIIKNVNNGLHRLDVYAEVEQQANTFEAAAEPLIKWLADNNHPHYTAIVTSVSAVLSEDTIAYTTTKFVND